MVEVEEDRIWYSDLTEEGMMAGGDKWKAIESEMNRFEAEISSLTRQPNFIPAQLRRAPMHAPPGPPVITAPPVINRAPAPVIISAAPQKYQSSDQQPAKTLNPPVPPAPQVQVIRPIVPTHVQSPFPQISQIRPMGGLVPMNIPQPPVLPAATVGVSAGIAPVLPGSSTEAPKPGTSTETTAEKQKKKKKGKKDEKAAKKLLRSAGGQIWEDTSLVDWDPSDFRLFCGDLGNDVTDEVLTRVFGRYPSFQKAKVIRDKRTNKTKGYGFVSFKDPNDFVRAIRELDGRYVGSRPIKLRKSNWKNRNLDQARKRDKERQQLSGIKKLGKR